MQIYNYQEAVENDVREYINDNISSLSKNYSDKLQAIDELNDELFFDDAVTGKYSGSYTFNSADAEKNLVGNWDMACDAYEEIGYDGIPFSAVRNPELIDVTIRCYLLKQAVSEVVAEIWDGE